MKAMFMRILLVCLICSFSVGRIFAGPFSDDLGRCLVVMADENDKKNLVNWIVRIITVHPDIEQKIGRVYTEIQKTRADLDAAEIVTKLLVERCPTEFTAALKYERAAALETAFTVLGRAAMQELMQDPSVQESSQEFIKYVDPEKWSDMVGN